MALPSHPRGRCRGDPTQVGELLPPRPRLAEAASRTSRPQHPHSGSSLNEPPRLLVRASDSALWRRDRVLDLDVEMPKAIKGKYEEKPQTTRMLPTLSRW